VRSYLPKIILVLVAVATLWWLVNFGPARSYPNANLIIFAFDGLQARHLSAYGYEKKITPNLDKFLGESYLFRHNISPAPWTVPSFMSSFTSMYPSEHKVVNKYTDFDPSQGKAVFSNLKNLSPQATTLAEVMKGAGYVTGGFTGDAGVKGVFGFKQGFDAYYDAQLFGGFEGSVPRAEDWLKQNKDKKFSLFVHGYDVHGQHAPAGGFDYRYVEKPYSGKFTGSPKEQGELREKGLAGQDLGLTDEDVKFWRAIYDEKINRADEAFGKFIDQLKSLGLYENSIIVVMSDHGTEFYEHKKFDHGHTLYGELEETLFAIHTPLQSKGKVITSLTSTIDLRPTVLGLLGIKEPSPGQIRGINLRPALLGADLSRDIYFETDYRLYTHKRAIQTKDGWKFILTLESNKKELYNLKTDPTEQINLIGEEGKKAYELEQKVVKHQKEMGDTGPWLLGCSPAYPDQCLK
jgi:choline-sulfatase